MNKTLLELATEIVQAQVTVVHMDADMVENALKVVYNTLRRIQAAEEEGRMLEAPEPDQVEEAGGDAVPVRLSAADSIQEDKVVCLECGAAFRQLTANHLRSHGMSPASYKKKYGFAKKQPLSAKALTVTRSDKAKQRGLPENLRAYHESRRQRKMFETTETV